MDFDRLAKLTTLVRVVAWLAVLMIVMLSVVPGRMRPHAMASGHLEHFTAYFIAGSLLAIGYPRARQWVASAIILALCGGMLEIIQLWIPHRLSRMSDFLASVTGAWSGIIVIGAVMSLAALRGRKRLKPGGR
jgi:peptidoglycan/LPS O-acetylase OafA/YrhL